MNTKSQIPKSQIPRHKKQSALAPAFGGLGLGTWDLGLGTWNFGLWSWVLGLGSWLLGLYSCSHSPYPGFSKTKNGLYYKIQNIGDGNRKAQRGDYITAQILIKSENDSVLYDTRNIGPLGAITFQVPQIEESKDYRQGYLYLSEGDSATFITNAYSFFIDSLRALGDVIPNGFNSESIISIETRVLKIQTIDEYEKEISEEKKKLEQGEFMEKKILEKYLADNHITVSPIANGMYYIKLAEGKGLTPDSGSIALINYRGSFLNGRTFDSNYETQPFEYIVGAEDQLIKGLETGVKKMHEGEKAKFIIPSYLAFGSSGSSTGIVPPFTTVIYEVELLKVKKTE
jgi:FKBP-type peptidyl-prolyl cis-trans isomerase